MENENQNLDGVIVYLLAHQGSKSEGVYPFLYQGRDKQMVKLFLKGDNPFENKGLLVYDGKKVKLSGTLSRTGTFVVESVISDAQEDVNQEASKVAPEPEA